MISIIIPIKNEPYIQYLINDINSKLKATHEIIVVDESTEVPRINNAKLIRQKSTGLGNAFKEGLDYAKGDIIVLMDGDGSHNPEYIQKMIKHLKTHNIVLGSKLITGGKSEDTLPRKIVTQIFSLITRAILWIHVKDPMSGFVVLKKNILDKISLNPSGFKIALEIIYKSREAVYEYPIHFRKRKAGKSKVGFNMHGLREAFRIVSLLFKLRFH